MRLGIFAKTFERPTLGEALDAAATCGLSALQFNLSLIGGPSLPEDIAPETAAEVAEAFAARGHEMAAVSGTYNMAHPDAEHRSRGAAHLARLIEIAPSLGTQVVTVCTGTRDAEDMWRAHPENATPEAWRDMLASLSDAVEIAERAGIMLGVEPEPANVIADAQAARRLLDEVASPSLGIVLDAANLVAGASVDSQRDVFAHAFALLGDEIVLAHAKDIRRDGAIVAAGSGDLDYALYLDLLADAAYDGPLILHGLIEDEVPAAVAFLQRSLVPRRPARA